MDFAELQDPGLSTKKSIEKNKTRQNTKLNKNIVGASGLSSLLLQASLMGREALAGRAAQSGEDKMATALASLPPLRGPLCQSVPRGREYLRNLLFICVSNLQNCLVYS